MNQLSRSAAGRRNFLRWLLIIVAVLVIGLMAVLLRLKLREDELVFQTAISQRRALQASPLELGERITINAPDGQPLAGILLRASPQHDSGYWILHLHGNADSAFSDPQRRHIKVLHDLGFSVLAFDYRGFGLSPGIASETHLYEDSSAAYNALLERGVRPDRIILWGHSLGGGPAVFLAARERAAALVLFGAFTSLPDIAQDTYPYLPVKWIAGLRLDSLSRLANIHIPILIAHSVEDKVVPFHHAQELFAAANEPKQFVELHDAVDRLGGHADALYEQPDRLAWALSSLLDVSIGTTKRR